MRRKVFLFFSLLLIGFIVFPKGGIALASDSTSAGSFSAGSNYYFIHYSGDQQNIVVNDNVTLTLTGWVDDSKTSVKGSLHIVSSNQTKDITMNVTDVLQQLVTTDNQSIYYRIDVADSSKVEQVIPQNIQTKSTLITKNDNGTSIEDVKTVDEYGTVINDQGLTYYKTDANSQKVTITKEEYDSLNSLSSSTTATVASSGTTTAKAKTTSITTASTQVPVQKPSISYTAQVQDYGWMTAVSDGQMAGTTGQAKRMEAIKISIQNAQDLGVKYSAHVQDYGWMNYASDGQVGGTTGQAKRMEAIKIQLTGTQAANYDIYYRVYVQNYGWLGWAKNGEAAGTQGYSLRVEAIEAVLVDKNGAAPGSTDQSFIQKPTSVVYSTHVQNYGWQGFVANGAMAGTTGQSLRLEATKINLQDSQYTGDIIYSTQVQDYGWLKSVSDGQLSGTTGQGKRVEAVNINLTGDIANYYDVYYRAFVQDYGWLGWAKDGMNAGTQGLAKRMEAIQIKLVPKGTGDPVSATAAFKNPDRFVSSVSLPVYRSYDELADYHLNSTYYNPSYTRYDVLNYGDKVTLLGENNYAAQIETEDGLIGWVQKDYLETSLSDDLWLVKETRTLRSSADVNSTNIGSVASGSMVYLLNKVTTAGPAYTEWYYIQTQSGQKGWIWGALSTSDNQGYDIIKYESSKAGTVTNQVDIFTPLNTKANVTADQINRFINYETGGKTTVMTGMGNAYLTAQAQSGLNAVYLLAHSGLETGWGTSAISNTKYNFYGIGAIDSQPAEGAYDYSSPEGGIVAGACWISDNYVIRPGDTDGVIPYYQPTLDNMRNDNSWHQYASDEAWAVKIGYFAQQFYNFITGN